jgi:hypothetical protein
MDPTEITTAGTKVVKLLRDTGPGGYSIAKVRDRHHQTFWGIRWNGDDDESGYPTARGYPVWFILPDEVERVLVPAFEVMAEVAGNARMKRHEGKAPIEINRAPVV